MNVKQFKRRWLQSKIEPELFYLPISKKILTEIEVFIGIRHYCEFDLSTIKWTNANQVMYSHIVVKNEEGNIVFNSTNQDISTGYRFKLLIPSSSEKIHIFVKIISGAVIDNIWHDIEIDITHYETIVSGIPFYQYSVICNQYPHCYLITHKTVDGRIDLKCFYSGASKSRFKEAYLTEKNQYTLYYIGNNEMEKVCTVDNWDMLDQFYASEEGPEKRVTNLAFTTSNLPWNIKGSMQGIAIAPTGNTGGLGILYSRAGRVLPGDCFTIPSHVEREIYDEDDVFLGNSIMDITNIPTVTEITQVVNQGFPVYGIKSGKINNENAYVGGYKRSPRYAITQLNPDTKYIKAKFTNNVTDSYYKNNKHGVIYNLSHLELYNNNAYNSGNIYKAFRTSLFENLKILPINSNERIKEKAWGTTNYIINACCIGHEHSTEPIYFVNGVSIDNIQQTIDYIRSMGYPNVTVLYNHHVSPDRSLIPGQQDADRAGRFSDDESSLSREPTKRGKTFTKQISVSFKNINNPSEYLGKDVVWRNSTLYAITDDFEYYYNIANPE